eukprot:1738413-Alexandrium_andersonii.AAC.1
MRRGRSPSVRACARAAVAEASAATAWARAGLRNGPLQASRGLRGRSRGRLVGGVASAPACLVLLARLTSCAFACGRWLRCRA